MSRIKPERERRAAAMNPGLVHIDSSLRRVNRDGTLGLQISSLASWLVGRGDAIEEDQETNRWLRLVVESRRGENGLSSLLEGTSRHEDTVLQSTRQCAGKLGEPRGFGGAAKRVSHQALRRRVSRPANAPSGEQANTVQRTRPNRFGGGEWSVRLSARTARQTRSDSFG